MTPRQAQLTPESQLRARGVQRPPRQLARRPAERGDSPAAPHSPATRAGSGNAEPRCELSRMPSSGVRRRESQPSSLVKRWVHYRASSGDQAGACGPDIGAWSPLGNKRLPDGRVTFCCFEGGGSSGSHRGPCDTVRRAFTGALSTPKQGGPPKPACSPGFQQHSVNGSQLSTQQHRARLTTPGEVIFTSPPPRRPSPAPGHPPRLLTARVNRQDHGQTHTRLSSSREAQGGLPRAPRGPAAGP